MLHFSLHFLNSIMSINVLCACVSMHSILAWYKVKNHFELLCGWMHLGLLENPSLLLTIKSSFQLPSFLIHWIRRVNFTITYLYLYVLTTTFFFTLLQLSINLIPYILKDRFDHWFQIGRKILNHVTNIYLWFS